MLYDKLKFEFAKLDFGLEFEYDKLEFQNESI